MALGGGCGEWRPLVWLTACCSIHEGGGHLVCGTSWRCGAQGERDGAKHDEVEVQFLRKRRFPQEPPGMGLAGVAT